MHKPLFSTVCNLFSFQCHIERKGAKFMHEDKVFGQAGGYVYLYIEDIY